MPELGAVIGYLVVVAQDVGELKAVVVVVLVQGSHAAEVGGCFGGGDGTFVEMGDGWHVAAQDSKGALADIEALHHDC